MLDWSICGLRIKELVMCCIDSNDDVAMLNDLNRQLGITPMRPAICKVALTTRAPIEIDLLRRVIGIRKERGKLLRVLIDTGPTAYSWSSLQGNGKLSVAVGAIGIPNTRSRIKPIREG